MSKKQLNEFFVALGLGDRKQAGTILESVVAKKLAKIVNENTPEFPVSGNGYLGGKQDDLELDDVDTVDQANPEADKWSLIAQYVAAKQAIGLGVVGDRNLDEELEDIRARLEDLGEEEVTIADTIASMLEDGEYEDVEQAIEVPEDFKEQLDAAMEQYSEEAGPELENDLEDDGDLDLDGTESDEYQDEEMVDDLEMEEGRHMGRGKAGMAGLGERMAMRGKKVVETDDLDDLDSTAGDGLDDYDSLDAENEVDDLEDDFDVDMEQPGGQSTELRNYIQDCVLNSNMDIDECYNAVRTQFGDHFSDEEIDQIYNDVIDNMPELNT